MDFFVLVILCRIFWFSFFKCHSCLGIGWLNGRGKGFRNRIFFWIKLNWNRPNFVGVHEVSWGIPYLLDRFSLSDCLSGWKEFLNRITNRNDRILCYCSLNSETFFAILMVFIHSCTKYNFIVNIKTIKFAFGLDERDYQLRLILSFKRHDNRWKN